MTQRTVAIALKIPDNAAYTALTTLRRLGIDVALVERSEIVRVDARSDDEAAQLVRDDETRFNPNKHRLTVLEENEPRPGELWIEQDDGSRTIGWRLYTAAGHPATHKTLQTACERLLCNPAVERATTYR